MKRIRFMFLVSIGTVALATVACGKYSAENGTGGSSSASGGSAGGSSGGSGGSETGGTTASESGGSGGNETGGTTASESGGSGGNASGGRGSGTGGRNTGRGGSTGSGGRSSGTGGSDTNGTGGSIAGTGGSIAGTGGATVPQIVLPGDVMNAAPGNKVVSAHSTVRVIVSGYTGPLYQLCKGTANTGPSSCKGTPQDVGSKDGYADVEVHNSFCSGGTCTITKIYDQSGQENDLEPSPKGGVCGPDKPANAGDLKVTINGHSAYGVLIKPGMGYRTGCSGCNIKKGNGMVLGDDPESMYWVTSQRDLVDQCCFDYGNAETTSNDDGNGTMETLYFGGGVIWGTGYGGKPGPWIMADLENGLYAGWENNQDKNISTNKPLKHDYVNGILLGDTRDKNGGQGRFALYGGDATAGALQVMYDGIRPTKNGYVPMKKQGSIILGTGGDNSCSGGGHFYEGAISAGPVLSKANCDELQAAIVAAKYKRPQ